MARRRRRKSDEAPGWVWMLFGLGIGLIIALGVYLNGPSIIGESTTEQVPLPPVPEPVVEPPVAQPATETGEETQVIAVVEQPVDSEPAEESTASVPSTREPEEDPNRFSFYDLLPSFEVVIPEVETPAPAQEEVVAIEDPGLYMLQAGSFLTMEDAEAQRARLALLGIESRIQRVSIDDRAFHRVRIGPIENLEELNSVRSRLRSADVDSMVMRVDP